MHEGCKMFMSALESHKRRYKSSFYTSRLERHAFYGVVDNKKLSHAELRWSYRQFLQAQELYRQEEL